VAARLRLGETIEVCWEEKLNNDKMPLTAWISQHNLTRLCALIIVVPHIAQTTR